MSAGKKKFQINLVKDVKHDMEDLHDFTMGG